MGEVEALDARNLGGVWVLDRLWSKLGIDTAIKKVARGRKLDAARLERVLFTLVASRALAPSSKLEVTRWVADDVHIDRLDSLDADQCYRAMDFLLEALAELQETVFFTAADLLNLDVDLVFFDTTSTYFELDFADGELDDDDDQEQDPFRLRGDSKDSRDDLPQVVIGMAVTTGGLPVRLWVWPGNTTDTTVLGEVKADLAGWQFSAALRGRGVYTKITQARGGGGGSGASLPQPLTVAVSGEIVGGAVSREVAEVVIELDGGDRVPVPLSGHGFLARFYAAEVPAPLIPAAVAVYDGNGVLLTRLELRRDPPGTSGVRAPLPDAPPPPGLVRRLELPVA